MNLFPHQEDVVHLFSQKAVRGTDQMPMHENKSGKRKPPPPAKTSLGDEADVGAPPDAQSCEYRKQAKRDRYPVTIFILQSICPGHESAASSHFQNAT